MNDREDRDPKLHNGSAADTENFSVDDIMEEFGSFSELIPPPASKTEPRPVLNFRPQKEPKEKPAPKEKTPKPPKASKPPKEKKAEPALHFPEPKEKPKPVRPEKPKPPLPSPKEALRDCLKKRKSLLFRCIAAWVLMALSAALTVLALHPELPAAAYLPAPFYSLLPIGLLLCHIALTADLLIRGVTDVVRSHRFSARSLLLVTVLLTLIRGFAAAAAGENSLCAAASLLLTFALQSEKSTVYAKSRVYFVAANLTDPTGVIRIPDLWQESDCLCRAQSDLSSLVEDTESEPATVRTIDRFSLLLLGAGVAVAAALALRADRSFFWMLNILLLGSFPLGGMGAFGRGLSLLSARLGRDGVVIPGYQAAERLTGDVCLPVTDEDLFTRRRISLHGIRTFGSFHAERVLAYAVAILEQSGTCVTGVFRDELEEQAGRHYQPASFRLYEAGGMGGEVQGDIVLLGGAAFLQSMGIPLPQDSLPVSALYLSVNGEAAGVFAIDYTIAESVGTALASLLRDRTLRPVLATRDVLLTPDMVQRKYGRFGVSADRLEYPSGRDRVLLSAPAEPEKPGALLSAPGFSRFVSAVLGARRLCSASRAAVRCAVCASLLGFVLMSFLCLLGAVSAVTPLALLIYHLLWLLPSVLMTSFIGK